MSPSRVQPAGREGGMLRDGGLRDGGLRSAPVPSTALLPQAARS